MNDCELLFETAKRVFKKQGNEAKKYFRCTVGPKKGKLTADPASCGKRPNPKRVRHGRIVAKTRGAIRIKKTAITKKTNISKRIADLNKRLNGLFVNRAGIKESVLLHEFIIINSISTALLEWTEDDYSAELFNTANDDILINCIVESEHMSLIDVVNNIYTSIGFDVEVAV